MARLAELPPSLRGKDAGADSVVAVSPNDVWAVVEVAGGAFFGEITAGHPEQLFAEDWNGTKWRIYKLPLEAPAVEINDMSASSSRNVWAVGDEHEGPGANYEVAAHWNGSRWRAASTGVDFPCAYETELVGVTALATTGTWAVGNVLDGCVTRAIVKRWNGIRFTAAPQVGLPHKAELAALDVAEGHLYAAGNRGFLSRPKPLVARRDPTRWSLLPTPTLPPHHRSITDVEPITASDIWAASDTTIAHYTCP
jgi:hypothetical protein